jgi:hypothetical protein
MSGWWNNAFGISALSIGNLAGSITITTVAPFISAFELNGEAKFGESKLAIGMSKIIVSRCFCFEILTFAMAAFRGLFF